MSDTVLSEEVDANVEATRQIILRILDAKKINPIITIGPVIRQTLFYVYEGGEPNKWSRIRPHSIGARHHRDWFNYQKGKGVKDLRYDHAIPLTIVSVRMFEHALEQVKFRKYLRAMVQGVIITKGEDQRLTAAGYQKAMPGEADPTDLMARYRAVGIAIAPDDEALLIGRNSN